jgi:hypothetical protein
MLLSTIAKSTSSTWFGSSYPKKNDTYPFFDRTKHLIPTFLFVLQGKQKGSTFTQCCLCYPLPAHYFHAHHLTNQLITSTLSVDWKRVLRGYDQASGCRKANPQTS